LVLGGGGRGARYPNICPFSHDSDILAPIKDARAEPEVVIGARRAGNDRDFRRNERYYALAARTRRQWFAKAGR
jgi:hypothetical protein